MVVVGTLSYPLAIISSSKRNSLSALRLSLKSIFMSLIISIPSFYVLTKLNLELTGLEFIKKWWYLFPLGFAFSALLFTLKSVAQREKAFGKIARINTLESGLAKTLNIILGFTGLTAIGLVISDIISRLIASLVLLKGKGINRLFLAGGNEKSVDLKEFPRVALPSELLSLLSNYLAIWFIAVNYSTEELGKYWLAFGLASLILHAMTTSFQPVFTQRILDAKSQNNSINLNFLMAGLGVISFTVFIILILIPEKFFTLYLGSRWQGVGVYINLISLWFIFYFVDQVLEHSLFVFKKGKFALWANALDVTVQLLIIFIAFQNNFTLYHFIGLFVLAKVFISIIRLSFINISLRAASQ